MYIREQALNRDINRIWDFSSLKNDKKGRMHPFPLLYFFRITKEKLKES